MAPDKEFSVTFALAGRLPQTVPVQITKPEDDPFAEASLQPNPVAVELAAAPKTPAKRTPGRKSAAAASTAKPAAAKPAAPRPAAPKPAASSSQPVAPAATAPTGTAADPWPPAR
jgi:hypothetical protein